MGQNQILSLHSAKMLDLSWNPTLIGIAKQLKYIPKTIGLCKTSTNWVRLCFQTGTNGNYSRDDTLPNPSFSVLRELL